MKFLLLFSALCIGTAQAAEPPAVGSAPLVSTERPWNVRDHVPLEKFLIQSHRGAGVLAEENTIEAFELGWSLGTYPESDIRTTKDGVIVAFHDNDFSRVVKGIAPEMAKKGVADVSFEELGKMDVGSWKGEAFNGRRVSKISEVFKKMTGKPERHLYLDIKNVDLAQLADEVKAANVNGQVVLASSDYNVIKRWKSLVPESDTLLWISGTEEAKRKQVAKVRAAEFAGITQIQIHVNLPKDAKDLKPGEPFSPSREFLSGLAPELAARGILFQTLPWGATESAIYVQLLDLGVASFATDHPDVTLQAVRDYYSHK